MQFRTFTASGQISESKKVPQEGGGSKVNMRVRWRVDWGLDGGEGSYLMASDQHSSEGKGTRNALRSCSLDENLGHGHNGAILVGHRVVRGHIRWQRGWGDCPQGGWTWARARCIGQTGHLQQKWNNYINTYTMNQVKNKDYLFNIQYSDL